MKTAHPFLLTPAVWLGQGRIRLSLAVEELVFFTRWSVEEVDPEGEIHLVQEIQIKGLPDIMHNEFTLSKLAHGEFQIALANDAVGCVEGKGVINDKVIAWEFRVDDIGFEGFEIYEKQPDDNYRMRAEYATNDQFRTLIEGKLWQKSS
jgi:hypothetical protein